MMALTHCWAGVVGVLGFRMGNLRPAGTTLHSYHHSVWQMQPYISCAMNLS